MQHANKGDALALNGQDLRVGIVTARFNEDVTRALNHACCDELSRMGVTQITQVQVPGALEVPLALQFLADQGVYHALVALGCIIRGETYHFELVANESGAGVTRVGLDHNIPIANAILTVENMAQAVAHQDEKGRDAARAAVEMALLQVQLYPTDTPTTP